MRQRITVIFIAAVMCITSLASCAAYRNYDGAVSIFDSDSGAADTSHLLWLDTPGQVEIDNGEPREYIAGSGMCTWGSIVIYPDKNGIKYQDMNNIRSTGLPLCNDALAAAYGEGDPFSGSAAAMIIDEKATAENDNVPIILIAVNVRAPGLDIDNSDEDGNPFMSLVTEIGRYDMLTGEWKVMADDITDAFVSLSLYKDTVFFTTYSEKDGTYTVHKMNRDGGGQRAIYSSESAHFALEWVYDDVIYYTEGGDTEDEDFSLYSCDLNFNNRSLVFTEDELFDSNILNIADGCIYYDAMDRADDSYNLYRRKLSEPSKRESVLAHAYGGHFACNIFYYRADRPGKELFSYDIETGEKKTVFEIPNSEEHFLFFSIATPTYVICDADYYGVEYLDRGYMHYVCIDLNTQRKWAWFE